MEKKLREVMDHIQAFTTATTPTAIYTISRILRTALWDLEVVIHKEAKRKGETIDT